MMFPRSFFSIVAAMLALSALSVEAVGVYQTSFEVSEGYNTNRDLVGQKGWLGVGSGGNGLVSGFFPGKGTQAYVGFTPPATNDAGLYVYQPLSKNLPQTQFSVTMAIIDSTNTNWDNFYWSVFNQQGQRLFTLDFANFELKVYYYLDGTNTQTDTGVTFTNAVAYQLNMNLDFLNNRWSATLGGALLATNLPLTTISNSLNFGDIDAAWAVFDTKAPGDNFMVFDDYQISASAPQPKLTIPAMSNGVPRLHLSGVAANRFAIEASTNLLSWSALNTNLTTGGSFDYADNTAVGLSRRFYRARWVP